MFSIALARIIYKFRFNKHTPENELLIFKKHMHVNSLCIYRCRGEVFFGFCLGLVCVSNARYRNQLFGPVSGTILYLALVKLCFKLNIPYKFNISYLEDMSQLCRISVSRSVYKWLFGVKWLKWLKLHFLFSLYIWHISVSQLILFIHVGFFTYSKYAGIRKD